MTRGAVAWHSKLRSIVKGCILLAYNYTFLISISIYFIDLLAKGYNFIVSIYRLKLTAIEIFSCHVQNNNCNIALTIFLRYELCSIILFRFKSL